MKYTLYKGNPRTDKNSKKIITVATWEEASNELARLRHELKTQEIYVKEEADNNDK